MKSGQEIRIQTSENSIQMANKYVNGWPISLAIRKNANKNYTPIKMTNSKSPDNVKCYKDVE